MPRKGKKSATAKLARQKIIMQQRRQKEKEAKSGNTEVSNVSNVTEDKDAPSTLLAQRDPCTGVVRTPLDSSGESNTSINCPDKSNISINCPDKSNTSINCPDKSNTSINCPNKSSPNKSNTSINCPDKSNTSINCPNKSNTSINCPNKSNNSINCPNKSNTSINCPNKSSLDKSSNVIRFQNQKNTSINCPYESNNSKKCSNENINSIKCIRNINILAKCSKQSSIACLENSYIPLDIKSNKNYHSKIADVKKGLKYADVVKGVRPKDGKGFGGKPKNKDLSLKFGTFDDGLENFDTINFDSHVSIQGRFHQGDTVRFGNNAGKQCVANCFVAIMSSKMKPIDEWDTDYLDRILVNRNTLYSHIHGTNDLLLVNDVPDTLEIFYSLVQCTKKESINAILGEVDPSFPCGLPLYQALQTALIDSDGCLISVNGFTSLAINQRGHLYLFDSHSRDLNGRSDITGSSIVIHLDDINHLYDILRAFVNNSRNCIFEITGVKVNILCDTSNSSIGTEPIMNIEQVDYSQTTESDMEVDQNEEFVSALVEKTDEDCIDKTDNLSSFENMNTYEEGGKDILIVSCEEDNQNVLPLDAQIDIVQPQISKNGCDLSDIEVFDCETTCYHFQPLDACSKRSLCQTLEIPQKHVKSKNKICRDIEKMGNPKETKSITGDGNCLFRAISYSVSQRQEFYPQVRKKLVNYILSNQEKFASFVELPYKNTEEHISKRKMYNDNVWGTSLEILAAADLLKTDIYTFYRGKWIKYSTCQINDQNKPRERSIYLKHIETLQHYEVVLSVEGESNEEILQDNMNVPTKKLKLEDRKPYREKEIYKTDINLQLKKQENQRLRYAQNTNYRDQKKEESTSKYRNDDYFRNNVNQAIKEKYSGNEKYRNELKQKSKEKYSTNKDFRSEVVQKGKEKYQLDTGYRSNLIEKSKEKYSTNADFRSEVIQKGIEKYQLDTEYRSNLIEKSKEKYSTNADFRSEVVQKGKEKYQLQLLER